MQEHSADDRRLHRCNTEADRRLRGALFAVCNQPYEVLLTTP